MNLIKLAALTPEQRHDAAKNAARMLSKNGSVLLVPTETVYGLVCRWDDSEAVQKIYALKHREISKKLALFVDNTRKLVNTGLVLTPAIEILSKKFCPGPITLIGKDNLGDTIGFRIPDNDFVQEILCEIDYPLASTSANRSGEPNALSASSALRQLTGEVDLAFDGGDISATAQASTVVLVDGGEVKILRSGPISQEAVLSALSQKL